MANYKPYGHKIITIGTVSESFSKSQIIKFLFFNHNGLQAPKSMLDMATNAVYQVPSGKTFQTLGLISRTNGTNGVNTIYQADTEDATTLAKLTWSHGAQATSREFNPLFTIASEKYITSDPASGNVYHHQLIGYET